MDLNTGGALYHEMSGLQQEYIPQKPVEEGMGFFEAAWGQQKENLLPKAYDWATREKPPIDVNWKNPVAEDVEVPPQFFDNFVEASSQEEYDQIKARLQHEIKWENQVSNATGLGKFGAFVSGMLDPALLVAAPIEEVAVGAKILQIGRLSAMLRGGAVLGASAGATEAALVGVSETKPWEDVYTAMAGGALIGGGLGSFKWGQKVLAGTRNTNQFQLAQAANAHASGLYSSEGYLNKLFTPEADAEIEALVVPATKPRLRDRLWNISMGDFVAKHSRSGWARALMGRLAETSVDAAGNVRHTTAAVERDFIHRSLAAEFSDIHPVFRQWCKDRGISYGDSIMKGEAWEKFGREALEEMEVVKRTGANSPDVHPSVKRLTEMSDNMYRQELKRAQEAGVEGAMGIAEDANYWHRRWDFTRMLQNENTFIPLLAKGLLTLSPNGVPQEAEAIARKVYNRMKDKFTQHADAAVAHHHEHHIDAMEEAIYDIVSDPLEADELVKNLVGRKPDKGPGYFRRKLDIDFSVTHNGMTLFDFVDTNVAQTMADRAAHSSGRIALARQGITSDAAWDRAIQNIRKDALKNPAAKESIERDIEKLEVVRRQLLGQATYDLKKNPKFNRLVRDLMDLTHLGTMGQMGVAQATEIATLLGENGLWNVTRALPQMKALKKALRNDPELAKDLACMGGLVAEDHKFMLPNLRTDEGRLLTSDDGALLSGFRNGLQEGKRLMNYLSLQNSVLSGERKLWAQSTYIRFYDHAMNPRKMSISPKRLADMGISEEFNRRIIANVQQYGKNENGVRSLGLHKWPAEDLYAFQMSMSRQMNTAIQGNLAGEIPMWATTSLGRVLAQFRNFPLVAFTKQTKRAMQYRDSQAFKTIIYGAIISTAIHIGRTELNHVGNSSQKAKERYKKAYSPAGFAQGAIRYLPAAAFFPDMGSFMAKATGMDYGSQAHRGIPTAKADLDIGDIAASGGYVEKAVQGLVAAPIKAATGKKLTSKDARAIIGLMPFNNTLGLNQAANLFADHFQYD